MKKGILIAARLLIAVAALWLALRKINGQELNQFKWTFSLLWLLPACLFYNLSQFTSAWRLLHFYRRLQPGITYPFNLRLYYQGMFYNLFLPGGIGGDAYKIIRLKNSSNSYRQLATATLLDRITGLVVLTAIITVLGLTVSLPPGLGDFFALLPALVVIGIPCYYILVYLFFKRFIRVLPVAALLSLVVQSLQFLSFYCILLALQAAAGTLSEYAVVFFVSSVIAALPISIGGIGTRELAMATGAVYFHFSETTMVSASLLFFIIVAASSLAGWFVRSGDKKQAELHGSAG